MREITNKILDILVEVKENPVLADEFSENSKIFEDIGLDSLEMINFVLKVEDEFNIEINFDQFDYSKMEDVRTFASFIKTGSESGSLLES